MKGKFITFEGGEGSGKTTQSKLLVEYLLMQNIDAIWTREIGGSDIAEQIRTIILHNKMDSMTELLLVMSARYDHVNNVILPALKNGITVVCDRFIDSTLCYQGEVLGIQKVMDLHKEIFGDLMPDVTFFIDVPVYEGLRRAGIRGDNNKFEEASIEIHEKLRKNFNQLVDIFPNRITRVDGMLTPENLFKEIKNILFL